MVLNNIHIGTERQVLCDGLKEEGRTRMKKGRSFLPPFSLARSHGMGVFSVSECFARGTAFTETEAVRSS